MRRIKLCIVLLVGICSACGFHLRGQMMLPDSLKTLHLSNEAPFDPFQKALIRTLQANQIRVITVPDPSVAILRIYSQQFSEQSLAVASDAVTSRIRITFTVQFEVVDRDQNTSLLSNSATASREFSTSQDTVLQDNNERDTLKDELRMDVIAQIMRQLSTLAQPKVIS